MASIDLSAIIPIALFGALVGLALDLWRRFREKPDDAKLSEPLEAPNTEPKLGVDRIVMVNKGENKWAPPSERTNTATKIIDEIVDQKTARLDKKESAESFLAKLSETKKRFLAGGILFLCLLSLVWNDDGDKVIGLAELMALCGAWVCTVLLWTTRLTVSLKSCVIELLQVLHVFGILLGIVMMIFGLVAILYAVSHPLSQFTNDTGIAKAAAIGVLSSISGFALFVACKSRDKKS
jgi:hypothetical protein